MWESRYYSNVSSLQWRPCVNHPKGEGRGIQEVIIYQSREEVAGATLAGAGLDWRLEEKLISEESNNVEL